jgi:hypothetical protein
MSGIRVTVLCALIAFVCSACADIRISGASSPTYAVAMQSCAPNDAPAVAIYLADAPLTPAPPPTHVRIGIWQTLDHLAGHTYQVAETDVHGAAVHRSAGGTYEFATRGSVRIDSVGAGSTVHGFADLGFPRAGRVRASFAASWLSTTMLCG